MTTEYYGELEVEKDLKQKTKCRNIVKEIIKFGVSNKEILMVVQYLCFELEDRDAMLKLDVLMKELLGTDKQVEDDNKITLE